jgi:hypothetical protein
VRAVTTTRSQRHRDSSTAGRDEEAEADAVDTRPEGAHVRGRYESRTADATRPDADADDGGDRIGTAAGASRDMETE